MLSVRQFLPRTSQQAAWWPAPRITVSNQELAIAYSLGFKQILVVNQRGILSEGILRYMGINTEPFNDFDDCCAVVERVLDRSGWTPTYSRRMRGDNLRFSPQPIRYGNHFGRHLHGRFLYIDIRRIVLTSPRLSRPQDAGNCCGRASSTTIPNQQPSQSDRIPRLLSYNLTRHSTFFASEHTARRR